MTTTIEVTQLSHCYKEGVHRVCAHVNDAPLWFESRDTALVPAPEAFACALLLPALERGAALVIDAPLCPTWRANAGVLMERFCRWWGYRDVPVRGLEGDSGGVERGKGTALCFSGGADSFFSLLRGQHPIDHLLFVHGYDVALSDVARLESYRGQLEAIAKETACALAIVRTNMREHPVISNIAWQRQHGGALAALGHLLAPVRQLVISASYPTTLDHPWGSHWKTDPLWSSKGLEIIHEGASFTRSDKLRALADEPLARRHLRVCWENRTAQLNCCRCEKCVRTMLVLAQCGRLREFATFEDSPDLVRHLNGLPDLKKDLIFVYRDLVRRGLEPPLKKAVQALIARSKRRYTAVPLMRLANAMRSYVPKPLRRTLKRCVPPSIRWRAGLLKKPRPYNPED